MPDTPSLKLTNAKLVELAEGLAGLDGLRVKGELEPFLFCPEVTWAISDNEVIVNDRLRSFNQAKKNLARQYKITEGMAITPQNSETVAEFMARLDDLTLSEVEILGLKTISREKLNVGHDAKKSQNRIAPSVLAKLSPLLED